jgi:gamma-glutamylcyclotransferase (GGCT)/AIG2-like uncharacterized protein YtfP
LDGRISSITRGKTKGLLYHLPEGYPALIDGNGVVEGEIMESVGDDLLRSLDLLEDYNGERSESLYVREVRTVLTKEGEEVPCWIYVYADARYAWENGILVPHGSWRKFMRDRGTGPMSHVLPDV